ncbi:5'-nucleotidase C-terminal domain-containing protein [Pseudoroseicyclus aestuarii]|uniref:2',3'-cyclic-nucleotide 2'-phosphodiesterase/3'-nucleotidase n=1 Tax=Pseudoroseicyclus aestuarii TaxID=1795041 RepID=A0A318SVT0_9RHOB|nr:5'-nucleotidase C-terminal domain-containing protein [Pseudoroseicyclus aestuarii]PYE83957.1 2',3'-cyclic-nucleotide 2'-phosphodiesterase/3'-nucleotidase [Pseudoroseicyclus aestuarii]
MLLQHEPQRPSKLGTEIELCVLSTTDLHGHVMPYDYLADRPASDRGLARTALQIRKERKRRANTLLFDTGDMLQGNPLADLVAADAGSGLAHPMIAAMNVLDYDAATLGNHDFAYGLPFLRRTVAQARFPIICSNLVPTRASSGWPLRRSVVIEREMRASDGSRQPLRIGLVGFAPPQSVAWSRHQLEDAIASRDIVDSAREEVPRLRALGADLVVALVHSGIGPVTHQPGMENAAIPLAAVEGIDMLLLGHTHLTFPGPMARSAGVVDAARGLLHGKPAVMPGFFGSHIGALDLVLEMTERGWRTRTEAARLIPSAESDESRAAETGTSKALPRIDAAVGACVACCHHRTLNLVRTPIGRTEARLHSHFALVGPDATLSLLADAMRDRARHLLTGQPEAALPLVVAVSPFRSGGRAGPGNYIDIPSGPLLIRHAHELYPFADRLKVSCVRASVLSDWLEWSALAFLPITRGRMDQPLLDLSRPSYRFDVLDGLTYEIDPSASPGGRVGPISWRGRVLDPEERVVIASNDHRHAPGHPAAPALRSGEIVEDGGRLPEILRRHIAAAPLRPDPRQVWRFAPLPGTGAWFDSGPGAVSRLEEAPVRLCPTSGGRDGFSRFVLHFDTPALDSRAARG